MPIIRFYYPQTHSSNLYFTYPCPFYGSGEYICKNGNTTDVRLTSLRVNQSSGSDCARVGYDSLPTGVTLNFTVYCHCPYFTTGSEHAESVTGTVLAGEYHLDYVKQNPSQWHGIYFNFTYLGLELGIFIANSTIDNQHTVDLDNLIRVRNLVSIRNRLTKKADKTELNTANTKVRVDYTTPHTKGTDDYTSIKSTLTSVNKRLNS